jgi:hypothetical protein
MGLAHYTFAANRLWPAVGPLGDRRLALVIMGYHGFSTNSDGILLEKELSWYQPSKKPHKSMLPVFLFWSCATLAKMRSIVLIQ